VKDEPTERVIQFENKKNRGANALVYTVQYNPTPELTFMEKINTIKRIEDGAADIAKRKARFEHQLMKDTDFIKAIRLALKDSGRISQNELIAKVIENLGYGSKPTVAKVLNRYAGSDNYFHRWTKSEVTIKGNTINEYILHSN